MVLYSEKSIVNYQELNDSGVAGARRDVQWRFASAIRVPDRGPCFQQSLANGNSRSSTEKEEISKEPK